MYLSRVHTGRANAKSKDASERERFAHVLTEVRCARNQNAEGLWGWDLSVRGVMRFSSGRETHNALKILPANVYMGFFSGRETHYALRSLPANVSIGFSCTTTEKDTATCMGSWYNSGNDASQTGKQGSFATLWSRCHRCRGDH